MRFTIFSCLIQYILPLVLISFIYFKIYKFLRTRRFQNATVCRKQKKTNCILLSVSLIFLVRWWKANKYSRAAHAIHSSWLPFSVFCIITEVFDIDLVEDVEVLMVSFFAFHMIGMSSTCTNPVFYGFLNESISTDLINKIRKVCFQIKVLV